MKKNLMQVNGVFRGSRYHPGLVSNAQPATPLSEEHFDEQFLQLDNSVQPAQHKEEPNGMNALEQALQDHLNKEKYEHQKKESNGENYEKYHLRIKKVS